jgi:hypothetical protein
MGEKPTGDATGELSDGAAVASNQCGTAERSVNIPAPRNANYPAPRRGVNYPHGRREMPQAQGAAKTGVSM